MTLKFKTIKNTNNWETFPFWIRLKKNISRRESTLNGRFSYKTTTWSEVYLFLLKYTNFKKKERCGFVFPVWLILKWNIQNSKPRKHIFMSIFSQWGHTDTQTLFLGLLYISFTSITILSPPVTPLSKLFVVSH